MQMFQIPHPSNLKPGQGKTGQGDSILRHQFFLPKEQFWGEKLMQIHMPSETTWTIVIKNAYQRSIMILYEVVIFISH